MVVKEKGKKMYIFSLGMRGKIFLGIVLIITSLVLIVVNVVAYPVISLAAVLLGGGLSSLFFAVPKNKKKER